VSIPHAQRLRDKSAQLVKEAHEIVERAQTILEQSKGLEKALKSSLNARNRNHERKKSSYKSAVNKARDCSNQAQKSQYH
jgi:hypothetical protein